MVHSGNKNLGFYRQLFELSQDAHLIIENNLFVDCNDAAVKMLGYPDKEAVLNTHPSELSPEFQPDGQPSIQKADKMMDQAIKNGSHRFLWNHKRANGEVFPVEVLLTHLRQEGSVEQIHTVWRDVTDRQKREQELIHSEARFRSYVENAPMGIVISNRAGQIIEINPVAIQMTGFSLEQIDGGEWKERIPRQNVETLKEHLRRVLSDGKAIEDLIYIDLHGTHRAWSVNSVRLGEDRFISFVHDITERHRMVELQDILKDLANDLLNTLSPEDMAKAAAGYLRAYFRSNALGIWYGDDNTKLDHSLYLEDTPEGGSEPIQYPQETHPYTPDFDSEAPERLIPHLRNRTPEELSRGKFPTVSAQERLSASIIFAPILWEGKRIGVISVHSYEPEHYSEDDLNDLQLFSTLIGSALQRAFVYQELRTTLKDKEALLSELQHRTRNNMNVIISLLSMQANEAKNEQLSREFKIIEDRIYAMSTAYNKLQQGESLHIINLREYLMALSASLYQYSDLDPRQVKLMMDCDDVTLDLEQAVPVGLIFNEVMSNAVTHAFPDGLSGSIRILLKSPGEGVVKLSVMDDGVGLSDEQLATAKKSMGFRIVNMLTEDQLFGQHTIQANPGCRHDIEFKIQELGHLPA